MKAPLLNKEVKEVVGCVADVVKAELGKDFSKAVSFWKQLRCINKMHDRDYSEMLDKWKILNSLVDAEVSGSLLDTAKELRDILCPDVCLDSYSLEELSEFVEDVLNDFVLSVHSERIKKESAEIVKMSLNDIEFDANGKAFFDSRKASKFVGNDINLSATEIRAKKAKMRIVESAEDGISRMLASKGLSSLTVFMGQTAQTAEEKETLNCMKDNLFRYGFYDVATKRHYIFAFQNPSSCRKANFMFVEANDWNQVVDLWLEITGFESFDAFKAAFFDESGKVVMAKMLARISTRGSNSFSLSKISPEYAEIIKTQDIGYYDDPEVKIVRDFKTLVGPGKMEMRTGVARKVMPGDGQMIGSFEFHALIAVAMRIISRNEYEDFMKLWAKAGKDSSKVEEGSRLYRLILKIPGVFQIRHGEKKGICVRFNLEAIPEVGGKAAIVPSSVRKFVSGDWNEFPLEICNYGKKKNGLVALNPQFIEALEYENPNAMRPIIDHWFDIMKESLVDIAKAQKFHGIIKSSDEDDSTASNLVQAMRASSDLIDDAQICNWRKDQYRKFINDMKIGRVLVPGQYSYMVCDPALIINRVYGTKLQHLSAGEFYFNAKNCDCGLFRSPLIHPFEAQKVKISDNKLYWYMRDVIVFNGLDGIWDRMGGADFDGDSCAIIPNDTPHGKLVVDGIRSIPFDIWEKGLTAVKKEFNMDNFIQHLVDSAKVDRTGIITNHASRALDISNHLRGAVYFAKKMNCDNITMLSPKAFGEGHGKFGAEFKPRTIVVDGTQSFAIKGFLEIKYNPVTKELEFIEPGHVGTFSFEEALALSDYYLSLVEILRILQGREIDGAKTGVYAEGVKGDEFIDAVKVKFTPHQMITRQKVLGREVSGSSSLNAFQSLSVLGRIHDYVCSREDEIMDYLANGCNKIFLLQSLLTDQEMAKLNSRLSDGQREYTLIEFIGLRKKAYNSNVYTILNSLTGEESMTALTSLKEAEVAELIQLADILKVSPEVIAVAAYTSAYTKSSKQGEGLTYGWLLFGELLSVFSRGNKKRELFRLPSFVEEAHIIDGILYVNGVKHITVDAYDCDNVVLQRIEDKVYGLIHKRVDLVVEERKSVPVPNGTEYTIAVNGFKYHIRDSVDAKESWKAIVRQNGYRFDITMDPRKRVVICVNGKSIAALMVEGADFGLLNKTVEIVNSKSNPIEETAGTIKNLLVRVVAEI